MIEKEILTEEKNGGLLIKRSNYSHNILFGDEDLLTWYTNNNITKSEIVLAGCITNEDNKIINFTGNMEYYDKISGNNIKALKIISDIFTIYYIINKNLSMISVVIFNPKFLKYNYYPISIYQNNNFFIIKTDTKKGKVLLVSDLKTRYLVYEGVSLMLTTKIESKTDMSLNNYIRIKCHVHNKVNIMHIATKDIIQIPKIIMTNDEPIYSII